VLVSFTEHKGLLEKAGAWKKRKKTKRENSPSRGSWAWERSHTGALDMSRDVCTFWANMLK
jgi:hypothetical protein